MRYDTQIDEWVHGHRQELLDDLKTLCRIRSVTGTPQENAPYGPGPAAALDAAEAMCAGFGFAVQDHDRRVMTADYGSPDGRKLDILAHLDVVDEGTGWTSNPYEPLLRDDGYLYGRGVADDKGGVICALYALRCVKELGIELKHGCRLIFGTDEECGSSDVEYYYRHNAPAPNTFTPDAEFPLCNAEKGFYRLRFKKSWQPAAGEGIHVRRLDGGISVNAVPGQASAELSGISPLHLMAGASPLCAELGASCTIDELEDGAKITVTARGCHAASPELGLNANTVLIRVLTELPLADDDAANALRAIDKLLPHGDYLGRALGIATQDAPTGELTCSFTNIHLTETGLEGLCDCRVPLCATAENCADVSQAAMRRAGFEAAGIIVPPHYTPEDTDFIKTLLACYEDCTGQPGQCYHMGGGTYVHDVPGGVAFGIGMPGVDVRMHSPDERFPLEDLYTSVRIFARAIAEICG